VIHKYSLPHVRGRQIASKIGACCMHTLVQPPLCYLSACTMSHVWIHHVTHTWIRHATHIPLYHPRCTIYQSVASHTYQRIMPHMWMRRVMHIDALCRTNSPGQEHTYKYTLVPHPSCYSPACILFFAKIPYNYSLYCGKWHVLRMNASCHTYECGLSRVDASCHTQPFTTHTIIKSTWHE